MLRSRHTLCCARFLLNGITISAKICERQGQCLASAACVAPRKQTEEGASIQKDGKSKEEENSTQEVGTTPVENIRLCHQNSISTTRRRSSIPLTMYRRPLPDSCIAFASEEGKTIFREALITGHLNCYFHLASQFRTQDEPAYCGLSTLIMVLNALEIDPGRVWKGPWKWYHEDMLDCCVSTQLVRKQGITFDEFICLAGCNSLDIKAVRVDSTCREEEFRELVKEITVKEDTFLVLAYSRAVLGQTGDGHFAPVSGYHPGRDLVLILDTARFKYPPHWVSLSAMFQSMKALDASTGLPRGYIQIWASKDSKALLLFKISEQFSVNASPDIVQNYQHFLSAWKRLLDTPVHPEAGDLLVAVVMDVLQGLVKIAGILDKETYLLTTQEHVSCTDACKIQCIIKQLLADLEATKIFQAVSTQVKTLPVHDVSKLQNIFGAWPSVWVQLNLGSELDQKLIGCNMEQGLSLCHFITVFLLSWPYSPPVPATNTLGADLQSWTQMEQSQAKCQFLKDEMTTLQRQLKKLTGYHSPSGEASTALSLLSERKICCTKEDNGEAEKDKKYNWEAEKDKKYNGEAEKDKNYSGEVEKDVLY